MSLQNGNACRVAVEDCRDFLRTGRCKYGSSCKYNHPANVQNGGGIKQLDPSEPMFPVRPNEPVCQYYMKHGTCKFGQACKFNHPPQSSPPMLSGGMNGSHNSRRTEPAAQLLLNPVGPDPSGQGMMLQFLPQRPEEADCIYFLKNGRCKYGATCRYHHPIHPQQPRTRLDSRSSRVRQDSFGRSGGNNASGHNVQYVTQVIHKYPTVVSTEGGGIITMDGSNSHQSQGYAGDTVHSYTAYQGGSVVMTEQSSSTSSMASSFETNQDMLGEGNRPRRNISVGSFNNGDAAPRNNLQQQPLVFMPHSISDGNIRRGRAASYGSVRDTSPPQFDPHTPWSHRPPNVGASRQTSDTGPRLSKAPTQNGAFRRGGSARRVSPRGAPDEGFTRMTSALLSMLDTTEEIVGESHSDEEFLQQHQDQQMHNNPDLLFDRLTISPRSTRTQQQPFSNHHHNLLAGNNAGFRPIPQDDHSTSPFATNSNSNPHQDLDGWKPAWQFSEQQAARDVSSAPSFPMLSSNGAPAPADTDIGLFLP